jgi:hypothetical protein
MTYLKPLAYAGATDQAQRILERDEVPELGRLRRPSGEPSIKQNALGAFEGFEQRGLAIEGSSVSLFQGLNRTALAALASEDDDRLRRELRRFRARLEEVQREHRQPVLVRREGQALVVSSVGTDGTLFEARVEE